MTDEFKGFPRADGSIGIRNHVAILPSVLCSAAVTTRIAEQVPGTIALPHTRGCGPGHLFGQDAEFVTRTLTGLACNPNVYAVLVIGLGCELLTSDLLADQIRDRGKPVEAFDLQQVRGGTTAAIEKGVTIAQRFVEHAKNVPREIVDLSHIIVGTECGGSDAISGITANPAVGYVADQMVHLGGTIMLTEVGEWIGTESLLLERIHDPDVKQAFTDLMQTGVDSISQFGVDFRMMGSGNIEGGLSTLEEKALGNIAKAGTSPIRGITPYAERPQGNGLWLMVGGGYDVSSMTGLAAAGAQVIIMTTGRGSPVGNPVAPVIKICGNPQTSKYMQPNIDVDASTIITAGSSVADVGEMLWTHLMATCNGTLTAAEGLGHNELALWHYTPFYGWRWDTRC
jgi:altronate dehydratase large subunit